MSVQSVKTTHGLYPTTCTVNQLNISDLIYSIYSHSWKGNKKTLKSVATEAYELSKNKVPVSTRLLIDIFHHSHAIVLRCQEQQQPCSSRHDEEQRTTTTMQCTTATDSGTWTWEPGPDEDDSHWPTGECGMTTDWPVSGCLAPEASSQLNCKATNLTTYPQWRLQQVYNSTVRLPT